MLEQLGRMFAIIGGIYFFLIAIFIAFGAGVLLPALVRDFFSALLKQGVKVTFRKIINKPILMVVCLALPLFFCYSVWVIYGLVCFLVDFLLD